APQSRTVLSDAYEDHAHNRSLAKVFFRADQIPFPKESFDFIISEHVLEHFSNPVKALLEWHRVLNPGGVVLLFLPHKERTFDKDRERTTLLHLMSDYESNVPDQDRTHLEEWITRVIEPGLAPHYQGFSKDDQVNKGIIHHHVWITEDMIELLVHLNMKIEFSCDKVPDRPDSFVIVARKNNQT
ncbi:MAG: class I SAM-dependent methyltransferase, partial [Oligoflexia bacterium]|nr:class I SAM-dependent methyltransferase [Oligoflexia bacterium]